MADEIEIQFDTRSDGAAVSSAILPNDDRDRMSSGDVFEIDESVEVVWGGASIRKSLEHPDTVHLVVRVAEPLAYAVAGQWLYEKLKGRDVDLRIGGERVEVDEEEIQSTLDDYKDS